VLLGDGFVAILATCQSNGATPRHGPDAGEIPFASSAIRCCRV